MSEVVDLDARRPDRQAKLVTLRREVARVIAESQPRGHYAAALDLWHGRNTAADELARIAALDLEMRRYRD